VADSYSPDGAMLRGTAIFAHIQLSSDMLQARRRGQAGRPGPAVPDVRNLYVGATGWTCSIISPMQFDQRTAGQHLILAHEHVLLNDKQRWSFMYHRL